MSDLTCLYYSSFSFSPSSVSKSNNIERDWIMWNLPFWGTRVLHCTSWCIETLQSRRLYCVCLRARAITITIVIVFCFCFFPFFFFSLFFSFRRSRLSVVQNRTPSRRMLFVPFVCVCVRGVAWSFLWHFLLLTFIVDMIPQIRGRGEMVQPQQQCDRQDTQAIHSLHILLLVSPKKEALVHLLSKLTVLSLHPPPRTPNNDILPKDTSEIERLQFNSPGPKMNGLDSPTPRAARSRSRGRTAPPTPAPIIEETSPQRPSVSPSRGSHRGRACTSTSSEDERATATTPSRSPLRRVPSPQRAAAAAAAATEGGTAANEAPVCNYL